MREDIDHPIQGSWSHWDHVRHWYYEAVFRTLQSVAWEPRSYEIEDIGASSDTGSIARMFFNLLGGNCHLHNHEYPAVDAQFMPTDWDDKWDVMIADQVLEHIKKPWLAAHEMWRCTKKGGLIVVGTPVRFPVHNVPIDCWRIMPDGYKTIFPENLWEYLEFNMWGTRQIVQAEFNHKDVRGFTGDWLSVDRAMKEIDGYADPVSDGVNPIVIWLVARKR